MAGQTFPSQEEADQAQRRLDNATSELHDARVALDTIIADANQLLARHDEVAKTVAELIHKACDQAPDEPGFWDRLLNDLDSLVEAHAQFANEAWDWVKGQANAISAIGDVFSTISTVTAIAGAACDATGVGAPVGIVLGVVSGVTSGVGLGLHGTAKLAGAEVSDATLIEDGLGVVSFGAAGAAAKAEKVGVEVAVPTLKAVSSGAGMESVAMTLKDYVADSTALKYFVPESRGEMAAIGVGDVVTPGGSIAVGLGFAFEHAWKAGSEKDRAAAASGG